MNLFWRFLWVLLFSRFRKKTPLLEETSIQFRVLPTDIDILFHMNNGRYFSFMDLARMDFAIRCGTYQVTSKNKIYPVVASEMIRFKKSIKLFRAFKVSTQLIGWDEKFIYLAQHFKCAHEEYALGLVKVRFLKAEGKPVSPKEILNLLGLNNMESPRMSHFIECWHQADKEFYEETMQHYHK